MNIGNHNFMYCGICYSKGQMPFGFCGLCWIAHGRPQAMGKLDNAQIASEQQGVLQWSKKDAGLA